MEKLSSQSIARIGVFSALYVVTSFVPISMFIGAPSFLSLNLIITPTIALLFTTTEAALIGLIGGVISLYIAPAQAMFGLLTILLPIAGAGFGSLAYEKKKISAVSSIYLGISIAAYLIKNSVFPYFVLPHILATLLNLVIFLDIDLGKFETPIYAYISTMCEQGMMMIFAVHLLGLPGEMFSGILPLMVYERLIGTIGGTLLVLAVKRSFPSHF